MELVYLWVEDYKNILLAKLQEVYLPLPEADFSAIAAAKHYELGS
jgi:hypothetical protein